jgi:hypothetical protein
VDDNRAQEWSFDLSQFDLQSFLPCDVCHPEPQSTRDRERREKNREDAGENERSAQNDQKSFEAHCGSML